ncbi:uncharacterized protein YoxC [Virgibacillus halotolerans]|uniref:DUF948 domain-containing protein n=1 Tax=Virgibacillus halotolerans TaxID=1071053 RepID=UPI00196185EA|nr:DUF948 domain-containing protein [Virgibacillus halotolerans]MBM7601835.1 uncharacterized protein YoxC [Virgibacillus halotolerans]
MLWVGIGLVIIGIAFFGLVMLLVKPLNKLAAVFSSLQVTTDQLPQNINEVITEVTETIGSGKDTLHMVNEQLKELSPMLHIIGDAGRATNHLSSSMVDAVMRLETSTTEASEFTHRNRLEGLYGALTLGYFFFQKGKEFSNERNIVDEK